ncbi:MAG TPA: hypothetical protein VK728_19205 [Candidatus Sulfotelmatobacter sp.]|nr:hypothetical protein [Candidatus Sulfotelmatobacter sp.]
MNHQKVSRMSVLSGFITGTAIVAALSACPVAWTQDKAAGAIPAGTILPIRLNNSLSAAKSHPGQIITARIMQDVPLANGGKIREGSKVIGHVVNVSSPEAAKTEQISLQFDKVISSGQTIPIKTNLRAVAGFVEVREAETPTDGPVSMPIAGTQVGGDTAYTSGGDVVNRNGADVGKSVTDGVLVQVGASNRQGKDCRGAVDSNTSPAAMWVFSSDACGTYGLSNIRIAHAGRTEPVGVIVLTSEKGQLKLPSDAGMLLRVQE